MLTSLNYRGSLTSVDSARLLSLWSIKYPRESCVLSWNPVTLLKLGGFLKLLIVSVTVSLGSRALEAVYLIVKESDDCKNW